MDIEEIQAELATIESDMQDMGYVRVEPELTVEIGDICCLVRATTRIGQRTYDSGAKSFYANDHTTTREALDDLKAQIAAAPPPTDQRRDALAKKLAEVIEEGRELGQSVDFLNPLEVSMKALSENAIAAE